MKTFLQNNAKNVIGVLTGFDRLVLRGTIRQLAHLEGMLSYLAVTKVLFKDFKAHVLKMTDLLKSGVKGAVDKCGRPVIHLWSASISKEDRAREIARRDGVSEGSICLLTSIEPCQSYDIYRNREMKRLELQPRLRKCLFMYHYFLHPTFGFMNARIQTWFPFSIQICINGREWLGRQMDAEQLGYKRRENCFVWLQHLERSQELMAYQLCINWPQLLDKIAAELNPAHAKMFPTFIAPYYWSVYQSEWATDLMFRDEEVLADIYPQLVRHGIQSFASPDVMRFLGRKVPMHGQIHGHFQGEVVSDLKHRPEGVRIKHRLKGNSLKVYDKQGSVLRVETTINNPRDFKVFRPKEGDDEQKKAWRPMRQGVADLHRRAMVSDAANERYIEALGAADVSTTLGKKMVKICSHTKINGRRVRGLRPWTSDDMALLQAINRGEFMLNGLRNRDLRKLLCEATSSDLERRRQSARITRALRMLRAHGILKKVPRTHRYQLTLNGRQTITGLLAADVASLREVTAIAA